jgi:hypothetical protein
VWLNGKKIGEHAGCFTAGYFDLTPALDWSGENRLVVRIGAHPGVLPENFPSGTDFEKVRWTPGIYDSVSVLLADNPVIQTVQVAPRINPPEILVQIKLKNYGIAPARCQLEQRLETWREARPVNRSKPRRITLAPGETKIVTETLAVPSPRLVAPEGTACPRASACASSASTPPPAVPGLTVAFISCAAPTSLCTAFSRTPPPARCPGPKRGCASSWWTFPSG